MMIDAVDINDDGEIDYSEFLVSLTTFLLKSIRWAVHLWPHPEPPESSKPTECDKKYFKMLVCRRILRMKAVEVEA